MGEAVFAVEDARQAVALDAEQAAVDRAELVAGHGEHFAFLHAHHDAAAHAAEAAGRFCPGEPWVEPGRGLLGVRQAGVEQPLHRQEGQAGPGAGVYQEFATGKLYGPPPAGRECYRLLRGFFALVFFLALAVFFCFRAFFFFAALAGFFRLFAFFFGRFIFFFRGRAARRGFSEMALPWVKSSR